MNYKKGAFAPFLFISINTVGGSMKKAGYALLFCCVVVNGAVAEECEPAVDVADSMNVNASSNCDYRESGLNRIVHGLFKKDQHSSSSESSVMHRGPAVMVSPEVGDADGLAKARFTLLSAIGQECTQGFRIVDELYLPLNGNLTIRLSYQCL